MGNKRNPEPPVQNSGVVKKAQESLRESIAENNMDRLAKFAAKDESDMEEGTAEYKKFSNPGETVDVLFLGTDMRNLDSNVPDKQTECAICKDGSGAKLLFAQTVIVKELKKKWDTAKELGFPARIIYKGDVGTGSDKYQSFRILFED